MPAIAECWVERSPRQQMSLFEGFDDRSVSGKETRGPSAVFRVFHWHLILWVNRKGSLWMARCGATIGQLLPARRDEEAAGEGGVVGEEAVELLPADFVYYPHVRAASGTRGTHHPGLAGAR